MNVYWRSIIVNTLDGMFRAASPIVRRNSHFACAYSLHSMLFSAWPNSSCAGHPTSPCMMSKASLYDFTSLRRFGTVFSYVLSGFG